jgi:hypothetical protein
VALDDVLARLRALPEGERAEVERMALEQTKGMAWVPNPGPQTDAYYSEADEVFYGGEAGGGKSHLAIGLALTAHRRSLILREFNADAQALGDVLLEVVGATDGWNGQLLRYKTANRLIKFAGMPAEKDKQRFKGDPHDLIVWDEVGDFFESQYEFVNGWNRTTVPGQRCRILATGNPPTRGKGLWVIRRWAAWLDPRHPSPALDGELRWYTTGEDGTEVEVDGPGPHQVGDQMVRARSRTFIRARLSDNPDLALTGYASTLAALPKELRDAYRDGRFDASIKDHPHQVIPTDWVLQAQKRWTPKLPVGIPMCAIAADPACGGPDDTVIAMRHDGYFQPLIVRPGKETPHGRDVAALIVLNRRNDAEVCIDMGGGYGGAPWEHLSDNGIVARAYKGAEATAKRTTEGKLGFTNLRSAAYWKFREALDPSQPGGSPIALPPDPELVADLTAPTFEITPRGIKMLPKDDVKELLGRSPGRADAVVMCWDTGAKSITFVGESSDEQGVRLGGARGAGRTPTVNLGPRRRAR